VSASVDCASGHTLTIILQVSYKQQGSRPSDNSMVLEAAMTAVGKVHIWGNANALLYVKYGR